MKETRISSLMTTSGHGSCRPTRRREAGQLPPVIVKKVVEVKSGITAQEQAEACRLRVEWMGELGHPLEDITTSLRYNRPQSAAEEKELLDVVRTQLEWERGFWVPSETSRRADRAPGRCRAGEGLAWR